MKNPQDDQKPFLTAKSLGLVLAGTVVLYWALSHISSGFAAIQNFFAVAMPLIQGMAIAYLLNLLMRPIEKSLAKLTRNQLGNKALRGISLLLTLLLSASLIGAVLLLLIPQLITSLTDLGNRLPGLLDQSTAWLGTLSVSYPWLSDLTESLHLTTADLIDWLIAVIQGQGAGWLSSTFDFVSSAFGWLLTLVLSLIFAIYLLLAKNQLASQINRVFEKVLPGKIRKQTLEFLGLLHTTFANFFTGQFIEALILGAIFFVILAVFGFPYALLISVVIAVTALIPMAGAYIGLATGAFLILLINPLQALVFTIVFLIIQQIENNLIYPRIVGGSIGLPAIWVLVAVVIGGGLFGVLGMILFIPLTSVTYTLIRNWVNQTV